ncbi:uncharacterized protein LOC116261912 isoform X2 [Nymphaea colorata]|uniref:uncharacterized protein LOC116261912 isoform X2 n=1 Tax=Nymphaea colorata TaxID=210225 RepID=UPI00129E603F|nr:uncharacterized protein LOC116261912 isoform X2 [Nymphaea colorata]
MDFITSPLCISLFRITSLPCFSVERSPRRPQVLAGSIRSRVYSRARRLQQNPRYLLRISLYFADEMKRARKMGSFNQYIVGRSSAATFKDAFEKQEAILRHLGSFDPTGEHLETSQKRIAAEHCNCTIADVENALSKFVWAKEAHKKMEKLKEQGKPMPKTLADVQKMMGSSPLDLARSNLSKSGQISRNALCPCGSNKKYKRCCGKDSSKD